MIPNLAIVRVETAHWGRRPRRIRLWVPLIVLWIPLILISPLILLVILVGCLAGKLNPWDAIATFWGILCSLPGTDVRVTSEGNHVTVRIL